MLISISAVVLLICLAAFFSGSETALSEASKAFMVDQEKNANDPRAYKVNQLFKNRKKFIITMMLGYIFSNLGATIIASVSLADLFGVYGLIAALFLMTFVILTFTYMLPQSYALEHSNRLALILASPVFYLVKILTPFSYLFQQFIKLAFRLFNIKKGIIGEEESSLSEIRDTILMYQGKEIEEEREMLESVLDLADVEVYDVMNHRKNLFSLNIDLPIKKIIEQTKGCPFSRIPVYKNHPDNIVGIIHIKTLLKAAYEHKDDLKNIKIQDLISQPWFIPDNTSLLKQLQLFRARREHFAIVVDEYGDLQGIVTLEDIIEEIVGDINDEYDVECLDTLGIRKVGEKSYLINGQVPLRDLNRKFDWDFDDENAVTLAGYLLDATQSIPQEGQKFIFNHFEFEIIRRNKNQLCQIKVTPPKKN